MVLKIRRIDPERQYGETVSFRVFSKGWFFRLGYKNMFRFAICVKNRRFVLIDEFCSPLSLFKYVGFQENFKKWLKPKN